MLIQLSKTKVFTGCPIPKQLSYSIALAVELEALCAGRENSDRARSPVSVAICRFLKLFIVKGYLFYRYLPRLNSKLKDY
jgi:hypothetical protein